MYGKLWLYSRYAPEQNALRIARTVTLQAETLYIIPSPCLCYGFDELLKRLPDDSAILCVELDPPLAQLCSEAHARYLHAERIAFVYAEAEDTPLLSVLAAAYRLGQVGRFRRIAKLRLSQGEELHAKAYEDVLAALEEDLSTFWRNKVALLRRSRLWTKNLIFNLGSIDWSRVRDTPRFGGQAVAVCGAGTSLDLSLPFLRDSGTELHIMACDTAAGALAKAGVRVDSVVCLEGQVYNVADFLPLEHTALLSFLDLSAHPSSYRALKGPLSIVSSRWLDSSLHKRLAASGLPCLVMDPLGSVGVLALSLARKLFSGPLFIAGLDFSYPQGRTHCLGSPNDIAERLRETRRYKAESRWRASFGEGTERMSTGFVSDPALAMYAALASRELGLLEPGRKAYDLRQGLGASLPVSAASFEEARRILAMASEGYAPARRAELHESEQARYGDGNAVLREKARGFLTGELNLAVRLRDALKYGTNEGELRTLVEACDYMYAHFPDPERVQGLELDALKRLAAEASYWEGRLRSVLA
jgi:hypothetical protein